MLLKDGRQNRLICPCNDRPKCCENSTVKSGEFHTAIVKVEVLSNDDGEDSSCRPKEADVTLSGYCLAHVEGLMPWTGLPAVAQHANPVRTEGPLGFCLMFVLGILSRDLCPSHATELGIIASFSRGQALEITILH